MGQVLFTHLQHVPPECVMCIFRCVHSKTKIQPETVSVDSLVFVKLTVVWSESSNTTQSIVATCRNELKEEN